MSLKPAVCGSWCSPASPARSANQGRGTHALGGRPRPWARRFGGFSPRRRNSFKTVGGIARHPHAFACATCHCTRWSSVEPMGIGCCLCHSAFVTQSSRVKSYYGTATPRIQPATHLVRSASRSQSAAPAMRRALMRPHVDLPDARPSSPRVTLPPVVSDRAACVAS